MKKTLIKKVKEISKEHKYEVLSKQINDLHTLVDSFKITSTFAKYVIDKDTVAIITELNNHINLDTILNGMNSLNSYYRERLRMQLHPIIKEIHKSFFLTLSNRVNEFLENEKSIVKEKGTKK